MCIEKGKARQKKKKVSEANIVDAPSIFAVQKRGRSSKVSSYFSVNQWAQHSNQSEMSHDNKTSTTDETEEAKDTIDDMDSDGMDADNIRPFIKDSVYYAAKDGLSIALFALLSSVDSMATKNAIINQVSLWLTIINYNLALKCKMEFDSFAYVRVHSTQCYCVLSYHVSVLFVIYHRMTRFQYNIETYVERENVNVYWCTCACHVSLWTHDIVVGVSFAMRT